MPTHVGTFESILNEFHLLSPSGHTKREWPTNVPFLAFIEEAPVLYHPGRVPSWVDINHLGACRTASLQPKIPTQGNQFSCSSICSAT